MRAIFSYFLICVSVSVMLSCSSGEMSVDKCAGVICGSGGSCEAASGLCVKTTCDSAGTCTKESCAASGVCIKMTCDVTGMCTERSCNASGSCVKMTCDTAGMCLKETCDASGVSCMTEVCDVSGVCTNKCLGVTCNATNRCDPNSGTCVSKCANVTCTAGMTCEATSGICIDKCLAVSCDATQRCELISGLCVSKCAGVACGDQICQASTGTCIDPPPPSLGGLIDRLGRPVINTALTNPFDLYPSAAPELSGVTKDRYNLDAASMSWQTNWSPALRQHLAIFDGIDRNCGNQLAFEGTNKYAMLAAILSDDRLTVDTTRTSCAQYLAVEFTALGTATNDCGGRGLSYDVVDTTYSALILGTPSSITDGISQSTATSTTFPFMATPQ